MPEIYIYWHKCSKSQKVAAYLGQAQGIITTRAPVRANS